MTLKKIIISGSMKYVFKIEEALQGLNNLGFEAVFPNLKYTPKNGRYLSVQEKEKLAWDHYRSIEDSDAIYCIVEDGYMGTSVKLELGYALALKKPIYYSALAEDEDLNFYFKKIISLDDLGSFKSE